MKKLFVIISTVLLLVIILVWLFNYITLQKNMNSVIEKDYRNSDIEVSVHYGSYIDFNTLVYDLTSVDRNKSPADIFRVLLQFAEQIKDKEFSVIKLEHKGNLKFLIDGSYFHTLGNEYSFQNPVYTMRTFPANLKNPDGTSAYSEWTGGWLGVLGNQLEDFNDFNRKWYLNDY
jgi:hypothetical protein